MVNIYVARHGQDLDNSNGILNGHRNQPLTDLGRSQAIDVGKKMLSAGFTLMGGDGSSALSSSKAKSLSAIYSSPLQRAHNTADIFVNVLSGGGDGTSTTCTTTPATTGSSSNNKMKVQILNDLIERDFGCMTGQPTSSIVEQCGMDHILATEKINYFLDPAGAETFPDLIERANRLLSHIQQLHSTTTAANNKDEENILLVTHGDFGKMIYAAYYKLSWEEVLKQFHFGNSEVLLLAHDSPPKMAHVFETVQFNA